MNATLTTHETTVNEIATQFLRYIKEDCMSDDAAETAIFLAANRCEWNVPTATIWAGIEAGKKLASEVYWPPQRR